LLSSLQVRAEFQQPPEHIAIAEPVWGFVIADDIADYSRCFWTVGSGVAIDQM